MEIGSTSGMQGMAMGEMSGMRRPPAPPADHAEKMSASIMEQQDADEDGLLTADEIASGTDSDLIAKLDQDGDGALSQAELQSGLESHMDRMESAFASGESLSEEDRAFMDQIHELAGPPPNAQKKAAEAYETIQEATVNSVNYDSDQVLLESLSATI